ncbi:MAG TPA: hypothetical protein VKR61_10785 [Bryobacteraceae bacterium]|nr:hypothetical protein [Bryobacteraceae bacterium]
MFARKIHIHLKPNSSAAFTAQIENETLPALRKQAGFQGELTFLAPDKKEAFGISLWDTKDHAETYGRTGYADVMKNLNKFIDGTPKVDSYEVANSTFHKVAAAVAV